MAVVSLMHGRESQIKNSRNVSKIQVAEIKFLRGVNVCTRV